jgi:hypothetical protein
MRGDDDVACDLVGENVAAVYVEDPGVDLDRRMEGGQPIGAGPKGRSDPAIKQSGLGQDECSGAQGRDPGPSAVGLAPGRGAR